jgi:hypothetical protein
MGGLLMGGRCPLPQQRPAVHIVKRPEGRGARLPNNKSGGAAAVEEREEERRGVMAIDLDLTLWGYFTKAHAETYREELRRDIAMGDGVLYRRMVNDVVRMLVRTRSVYRSELFERNFQRELEFQMSYNAHFRAEVDGWVNLIATYTEAAQVVERGRKGGAA